MKPHRNETYNNYMKRWIKAIYRVSKLLDEKTIPRKGRLWYNPHTDKVEKVGGKKRRK